MKKIITICLLLLGMNGIIKTQTADDYFPHAVGNTWQYQTMEGGLKTTTITKDSTDSNGNIFLNYDNTTGMFEWLYKVNYAKDSVFIFPTQHNELEYVFPLNKGYIWIIGSSSDYKYVGYVYDTYKVEIFGDSIDACGVAYFGTTIDDTISWPGNYLAQPIRIMAKGFGVIEEYEETTYKILTGAIINGKTYGKVVSVETEDNILPSNIELYQNYPNPFNPSTVISWQLAESSNIQLKVYDILGREIKTLVNTYQPAGKHEVLFDGLNLPSGIYIYRLSAGNKSINKKMLFIK